MVGLFSLYILFSHFRPRNVPKGIFFLFLHKLFRVSRWLKHERGGEQISHAGEPGSSGCETCALSVWGEHIPIPIYFKLCAFKLCVMLWKLFWSRAHGHAANDNHLGVFLKIGTHHDRGLNLDWNKSELDKSVVMAWVGLPSTVTNESIFL